jgi:hypothetical protein
VSEDVQRRGDTSLLRLLGAVLWPSFLTAGVATMVFFANVDPETLRYQTLPHWQLSREAGYTVGFFMFWAVCAASSALTLFLFRPAPGRRGSDE